MAVDHKMWKTRSARRTPTGVSVAIGWTAMIAASLVAAALVPDLRAVAAVTGLAMATFVGFLANQFGELTAGDGAWSYAVVIGFGGVLGIGYRFMRQVPQARRAHSEPLQVVADDPFLMHVMELSRRRTTPSTAVVRLEPAGSLRPSHDDGEDRPKPPTCRGH